MIETESNNVCYKKRHNGMFYQDVRDVPNIQVKY